MRPSFDLDRLLSPLDAAEFLEGYWGREPLVCARNEPGRFAGLFGPDELEEYLFIAQPEVGPLLKIYKQGEWPAMATLEPLLHGRYTLQVLYDAVDQGHTLVLIALQRRWPAVRRLVDDLERRLRAPVSVNAYVSGKQAQAVGTHADDHEVLILQTWGSKRWTVHQRVAPEPGFGPVMLEPELRTGDLAYLPAGFAHSARTAGEISIHLTIGIYPTSWRQVLGQLVASGAAADARLLESVPPSILAAGPEESHASSLASGLADALGPSFAARLRAQLVEHDRRFASNGLRANPAPGSYLRTLAALDQLHLDVELEHRPGLLCFTRHEDVREAIYFDGRAVHVPERFAEALAFVAAHRRFRIGDLPDRLGQEGKVVLARKLIRDGLLQLAETVP